MRYCIGEHEGERDGIFMSFFAKVLFISAKHSLSRMWSSGSNPMCFILVCSSVHVLVISMACQDFNGLKRIALISQS